jgi:hypothetical protein
MGGPPGTAQQRTELVDTAVGAMRNVVFQRQVPYIKGLSRRNHEHSMAYYDHLLIILRDDRPWQGP